MDDHTNDFEDTDLTPRVEHETLTQVAEAWRIEREQLRQLEQTLPSSERPTRNMRPLRRTGASK